MAHVVLARRSRNWVASPGNPILSGTVRPPSRDLGHTGHGPAREEHQRCTRDDLAEHAIRQRPIRRRLDHEEAVVTISSGRKAKAAAAEQGAANTR